MGDILDSYSASFSPDQAPADSRQGYAGPVPGRGAPGKGALTDRIPPRNPARAAQGADPRALVKADDLNFIEHGHACSNDPGQDGCIWEGPDATDIRMRLGQLIGFRLPTMNADMHAAIGRLLLDTKLAKAPVSLALIIIGAAFDILSSSLITKIGALAKATATAAQVAQGISQAVGDDVSVLVSKLSQLPTKQVETAAKTLSGVMKDKVKKVAEKSANHDFESNRAAKVEFLQNVQNGLSAMASDMISTYTNGSDVDALVLLAMLEHRPDVNGFEAQFRDLTNRFISEEIPNIGKKKDGITEAKYKLVRIEAYGRELYLNVLTAEGPRVGAKPRMVGTGGQNKDIIDPDKSAELVAIVSPDLVPTAIANNGGTVETMSMTWEEYQDGKTPVPTLDLFRSDGYLFGPAGKFEIWIRNAYMKAHGGQVPDDVFWFAPDKSDKKPATPVAPEPQPSATSPGDVSSAAGVLGDVDDAFKLF